MNAILTIKKLGLVKLPRPVSLDNNEVALFEFTSYALNNSAGFLCIIKFIGDDVAFTDISKIIMVPVN